MFDGKPEDRQSFALYILDIEIDHRERDGVLVPYEKITLGKKGDSGFVNYVDAKRLEKDNPPLYQHLSATIEHWRKTQAIATTGHPVEAWPILNKSQIKTLKSLGLGSVEDVAAATDGLRERYGMGFADLQKQAKAFLEHKQDAALAKQYEDLKAQSEHMAKELQETRAALEQLLAEQGKKPVKLNLKRQQQPEAA